MPPIRDQQEPIKHSEVVDETGNVAQSEDLRAALSQRRPNHQSRRNPRKPCNSDFRECPCPQQSCNYRQQVTTAEKRNFPGTFHPPQIAPEPAVLKARSTISMGALGAPGRVPIFLCTTSCALLPFSQTQ